MKEFTFLETTIQEIHEAMMEGKLTCVELVEWYLKRIEEYDPVIQSVVNLNPKVMEEAKTLDDYFKKEGKLIGPLHGVPVLVKDQVEAVGMPATFGSVCFKDYIPEKDGAVPRLLKEAGAIILAKTNLCEFGGAWYSFSTINGHTKNPYDLTRDTGGSSAGTGASVAANFGLVGIGGDTGGSVRIPSAWNNLFGLRCTKGMISASGFAPLLDHQDTAGPMTRSVRDLAKLLDVIVAYDPEDKYTSRTVYSKDIGKYEDMLEDATLKGARIGILREAFGSDDDERMAPVNKSVAQAIKNLEKAGAVLIDPVEIPDLKFYLANTSLYSLQSKSDITKWLQSRDKAPVKSFLEIYHQRGVHPLNDLWGDMADGPIDPTYSLNYYQKRELQHVFHREILGVFAKHNLDAILFPDLPIIPPTREWLETEEWDSNEFETNTIIGSFANFPGMSIPSELTDSGLPVGFELLGRPYQEGTLVKLAYAYEQLYNPRRLPDLSKAK